jgi:hypothetical protein
VAVRSPTYALFLGTGVYTRLGFRQVCSLSLYAWEPPI